MPAIDISAKRRALIVRPDAPLPSMLRRKLIWLTLLHERRKRRVTFISTRRRVAGGPDDVA